MKITKTQLKQLIKEEIESTMDEGFLDRLNPFKQAKAAKGRKDLETYAKAMSTPGAVEREFDIEMALQQSKPREKPLNPPLDTPYLYYVAKQPKSREWRLAALGAAAEGPHSDKMSEEHRTVARENRQLFTLTDRLELMNWYYTPGDGEHDRQPI